MSEREECLSCGATEWEGHRSDCPDRPPDARSPRTAAGRALLAYDFGIEDEQHVPIEDILAIEAEAAGEALTGAGIVRLLHSVGNTLAGWVRRMEGYGDDALAHAIDFVIAHPDLNERMKAARAETEALAAQREQDEEGTDG